MSIAATDPTRFLSALQSAHQGIERGMTGLARDAHEIARARAGDEGGVDAISLALVDSLQQSLLVQASARILHHVDKTVGSLLDTRA